ncbi:MAG: crossover junction endodeoxyribonuclease RuvC [candidate division WOR-3 bacterium]
MRKGAPGRILGVDPGLSATGFGIIDKQGGVLTQGVIKTDPSWELPVRLFYLGQEINKILRRYQPECCAIESLFFKGGGARSVILSAESRGVILAALARNKIPVYEITPATVKLAVTGSGRASKRQLNYMIRKILKFDDGLSEHAADALAVAYCLRNRLKR